MKGWILALLLCLALASPAEAHGKVGRAFWLCLLPVNAPLKLCSTFIDAKLCVTKDGREQFKDAILYWWYCNTELDGSGN